MAQCLKDAWLIHKVVPVHKSLDPCSAIEANTLSQHIQNTAMPA